MKPTLSLKKPLSLEKQSEIFQMMGVKDEMKPSPPENQNSLESTPQKKKRNFISVKWLEKTYPACFDRKNPKPLKKGILKDILTQEQWTESKVSLKKMIAFYVGSPLYHQAILREDSRYDLRGEKVGEVSEPEREFSKKYLTHTHGEKLKTMNEIYDKI